MSFQARTHDLADSTGLVGVITCGDGARARETGATIMHIELCGGKHTSLAFIHEVAYPVYQYYNSVRSRERPPVCLWFGVYPLIASFDKSIFMKRTACDYNTTFPGLKIDAVFCAYNMRLRAQAVGGLCEVVVEL